MFIKEDNGKLRMIDSDSNQIVKELSPGIYSIEIIRTMFGKVVFLEENTSLPKTKLNKVGVFKEIDGFVDDFFSDEGKEVRREMKLDNRFGLLFKGDPGTGKTFLACKLAEKLVEKENAVCILSSSIEDLDLKDTVDIIRRGNNPDQLVVFILDEFEKSYGSCDTTALLGFLDGTDSKNNTVVIATANEIKRLPNTLLKRPGRFQKVVDFKIDNFEILQSTITNFIPEKYKEFVSVNDVYSLIKNKKDITIDSVKSIVHDFILNNLKGRSIKSIEESMNSNLIYKDAGKDKFSFGEIKVNGNFNLKIPKLESLIESYYNDDIKEITLKSMLRSNGIKFTQVVPPVKMEELPPVDAEIVTEEENKPALEEKKPSYISGEKLTDLLDEVEKEFEEFASKHF